MMNMSSATIMQVAVSSVNWGLNVKPSLVKNSTDLLRFLTGRFTKILVAMFFSLLTVHLVLSALSVSVRASRRFAAKVRSYLSLTMRGTMIAVGCLPLCPHLCFDDVWFRALHKCDYLVTFSPRDLKSLQSSFKVPQKSRPIAFTDFHPLMGDLHISSGVVQGTACTRTQKINQKLLFPL